MRAAIVPKSRPTSHVASASGPTSARISSGVALEEGSNVVYSFTKLESIKPAMIGEATKQRESILATLVTEKATLEQAVASLRAYEVSYRDSIKTFLTTQLQEVEQARLAPEQQQPPQQR